ncbi:restriction endonuclease [Comamonas antarctica]|uniref:Restriction endonuclease n=1 Tax=Comamonas antarctica TaxID=2743470 RepID=A0A6N1XAJ1_9BURK|nr:restriction endonuclease [Comamonas antarctica]QKV54726.1 restriction endonuclease [Comamonas antarctica]
MSVPWRVYQEKVADLFRALGFAVHIEGDVVGARAVHAVDVVATRTMFGVAILWIVECKLWNTAIPKEKVLALAQIATDVGADRAFLLSESGFQAGALRAAQKSNITLTSFDELVEHARPDMEEQQLAQLGRSLHLLQRRIYDEFDVSDYSGESERVGRQESPLDLLSIVFELKTIALPHAQAGEFPLIVGTIGSRYESGASFIEGAEQSFTRISACLDELHSTRQSALLLVQPKICEFTASVKSFLDATEAALDAGADVERLDASLAQALTHMKRIGKTADDLRTSLGRGEPRRALAAVMRLLIDGPYLFLADPQKSREQWIEMRPKVEVTLARLSALKSLYTTGLAPVVPYTVQSLC